MQSTFGKTIESRIIPSLSKTISRCADEAFKDWKNKIDSSINAMVSVSAHAHAEDTPERKKVTKVWSRTKLKQIYFSVTNHGKLVTEGKLEPPGNGFHFLENLLENPIKQKTPGSSIFTPP